VRKLLPALVCALAIAGCDTDGGDEAAERPDEPAGASREAAPRSGAAVRPTGDGRVEAEEIRAPGLREHLRALQGIADANDGDRAAGTPGDDATLEYIAETLREAGWQVRLDPVTFPYFDERSPPRLVTGTGEALAADADFRTLSYSGSGRVEGPVRRLGLGCSRGDFRALEEGEVAVGARGECLFRDKARNAEAAGAAALLIVDGESDEPPSATLVAPGIRIPVLTVGAAAGRELGARVQVEVDAVSERRRTANVIAETAGGRGERVVMAGGHLDSVPAGPGINDNGSGVAALLELADALGGRAPGGPVRLAFWGAEELGLIGSRRYVAGLHETERERIAAYVNLDMVGSPNPARGVYSDADPGVERLLRRLVGPGAEEENAGGNSDHAPFQRAGIPVGGLFTGAGRPHDPCYHRACDDIDNVDMPVLVEMARAAGEAVERLSARN
jgi:Iap family predicted aminopeptidase